MLAVMNTLNLGLEGIAHLVMHSGAGIKTQL
jgi:hypothetical protein